MPSEVIKDFRYDEQSRTLFVIFQSGELYAYDGVEPETYAALTRSISRGRFFMKHVRDRYAYAPSYRGQRGDKDRERGRQRSLHRTGP